MRRAVDHSSPIFINFKTLSNKHVSVCATNLIALLVSCWYSGSFSGVCKGSKEGRTALLLRVARRNGSQIHLATVTWNGLCQVLPLNRYPEPFSHCWIDFSGGWWLTDLIRKIPNMWQSRRVSSSVTASRRQLWETIELLGIYFVHAATAQKKTVSCFCDFLCRRLKRLCCCTNCTTPEGARWDPGSSWEFETERVPNFGARPLVCFIWGFGDVVIQVLQLEGASHSCSMLFWESVPRL